MTKYIAIGALGVGTLSVVLCLAEDDHPGLSATVVVVASRSTLCAPSLHTLLEGIPDSAAAHCTSSSGDSEGKSKSTDRSSRMRKLKHEVIEVINQLLQEIDTCHELIAEQAVEHIHQKWVVVTLFLDLDAFERGDAINDNA